MRSRSAPLTLTTVPARLSSARPGVERIDADDEEPRPLRLIVDRGATGAPAAAFCEAATESSNKDERVGPTILGARELVFL